MSDTKSILTPAAAGLHLSPTLEINELVTRTRAAGKKVIHLGFGEATFPIPEEVLKLHRESSDCSSYLPVTGLESLRTSIAGYQSGRLGVNIRPEQVVVAPGSKPLLFALFDIIDGDVLLPRPSWVSYEPQVAHSGKKLYWVETDKHDRHTITEESMTEAYNTAVEDGARPKIMLINSPSNPTGQVFSQSNIEKIVRFCREREILLISDEIYSDICFSPEDRSVSAYRTALQDGGDVIMTGGLSKTYSAGGWRVGFAIFPQSSVGQTIQRAILAYASECWSAASAPAQIASAAAFASSFSTDEPIGKIMDDYRDRVTALHKLCTTRLYRALVDCGLEVAEPKGSFYLYPSFSPYTASLQKLGVETSAQLSKWLIEDCGLATLPGSAFGEDDKENTIGPRKGSSLRLRMATSFLYYPLEEKYIKGHEMLEKASQGQDIELPLLDEAIASLKEAVRKLK